MTKRIANFDMQNRRAARRILASPKRYPPDWGLVVWARRIMAKAEASTPAPMQPRLPGMEASNGH